MKRMDNNIIYGRDRVPKKNRADTRFVIVDRDSEEAIETLVFSDKYGAANNFIQRNDDFSLNDIVVLEESEWEEIKEDGEGTE